MWVKLDEIKGENAYNAALSMIDPVLEIAADMEAADIFYPRAPEAGETPAALAERIMRKCIPLLLKNHRGSVFAILAANQGKTVEEYRENIDFLSFNADFSSMIADMGFCMMVNLLAPRSADTTHQMTGKYIVSVKKHKDGVSR